MQIIILALLGLMQLTSFQTENYYIIKVKGDIYNESAGKILQQGDAVKASDKLTFKQKDAMAMVISDSRGRFTLKYPEENNNNNNNALYVFVKTALVMNKQNQLSTRAIGISNTVSNLRNYFGDGLFNIISDTLQIKLSKKYYPISEGYNIVVSYNKNHQNITQKISGKNQTITISRSNLNLKPDIEVYIPNIFIYKINTQTGTKRLISKTDFRFVDQTQLNKEFNTIIDKFYEGNKSEIQNLLIDYFKDVYGKTDEILLSKYVNELINKHSGG